MTQRVDKDSLALNQPRRTPGHPTKSHIVKTKVDGKEKIIRFGEQGASTAGKPKAGESDRMTAKRESFKARHAKNIAKGPSSPAYWANKVKWADGGSVRTHYAEGDSVRVQPQNATLGAIANLLKQSYSPQRTQQMQGVMELFGVPAVARTVERLSYGQPITNVNKANVPLLLDDTAEAAMVVGPMAGPLARVAKTAGKAGARVVGEELNRAILDNSGPLAKLVPEAAKPLYVVKPKGGNWLSGSVESAVQPLKRDGFIDVPELQDPTNLAINRWLDTKLSKYVRNEMGTPEDPVRALAERGILHVEPESGLSYHPQDVVRNRMAADSMVRTPTLDSPGTRMGVMPPAREWEDATDAMIVPRSAGDLTAGANKSPYWETSLTTEHRLEQDPWLAKVPPETPVYQFGDRADLRERLGLDHLVDELKFSLDPTSGLPDNLRFDIKDIDKITVPQAVERVSQINAWRAKQAAEAEKAGMMQNLTATPRMADDGLQLSFVEKPGATWVDIPDTVMDEKGMPTCTSIGKAGGWCTQNKWAAESYGSGPNRLTTLLDAEGRPHAQAKITSQPLRTWDDVTAAVGPEQAGVWWEELDRAGFYNAPDPNKVFDDFINSKNITAPANITELKPPGNSFNSDRAVEYTKRDPKYKEKVTQSVLKFLNSGDWGKVNDLDHYDIVDLQDTKSLTDSMLSLYADESSNKIPQAYVDAFNVAIDETPEAPRFMTYRHLRDFVGSVGSPDTNAKGFARGGSVSAYDPFQVEDIMNSINAPRNYAEGGSVKAYDSSRVDAILNQFM